MSKLLSGILFTLGYVTAGLIAVVAVGGLTYHRQVLHFPEPLLSLLLLGLTAALIYASVQMDVPGYTVPVIMLSLMARVALSPRSYSILAAAIYTLIVGLALIAGAYVQKSLAGFKFGRFIGMGLSVGVGYALLTVVLLMVYDGQVRLGAVWEQTLLGMKLGAALGLGFELIDLIGPRPEKP